jgi:hypothetical protein
VGEKELSETMKDNFHTFRGKKGLDVANISDDVVPFLMQVLACKLLRKFCKDEVPTTVITTMEKCTEGVQMNWDTFVVNLFLIDCIESQEKGMQFHYSWLLILIALVGWKEPSDC